ncbi:MAG: response regulator [Chitinivibrionales bacterium]|nr:response regulator [Chitinivibrionales bacterium]
MNIIIIDDEEIILQSLAVIFKRDGLEVTTEANPLEALKLYEKQNFNIVLVDVLMPEMKGAEVIRNIKNMNPLANIIVMTAFSNMTHVVECIEAGAFDYITKPFSDINLLLKVIRSTVQRVERWRQSFGIELHNVKK